jgi:tetratricopeptide (TPR) repeat protein
MKTPSLLCGFVFLCLLAGAAALNAQSGAKPDALAAYRAGRDMEDRRGLAAAEPYYAEAARICSNEIAQNRATSDSYTVLAWTLQRQRKYQEVITWGERGLGLYPDDYRIVEIMGEAYFYLNDFTASLRTMQRYVNAMPRGDRASVAYFFAGEIYRLQRKYRRADIAYTTAVFLWQDNALWWFRLGGVREAAGDYAPAAEAYLRALSLTPGYQEASEALARVRNR